MPAFFQHRWVWRLGSVSVLCIIVLLISSWWLLSHRSHRVNEAAFAKIHDGMTREELAELLGASNLRSTGYSRAVSPAGACVTFGVGYYYSEDDESWLIPGDVIVVGYEGGQLTKRYCKATFEEIVERIGARTKRFLGR